MSLKHSLVKDLEKFEPDVKSETIFLASKPGFLSLMLLDFFLVAPLVHGQRVLVVKKQNLTMYGLTVGMRVKKILVDETYDSITFKKTTVGKRLVVKFSNGKGAIVEGSLEVERFENILPLCARFVT